MHLRYFFLRKCMNIQCVNFFKISSLSTGGISRKRFTAVPLFSPFEELIYIWKLCHSSFSHTRFQLYGQFRSLQSGGLNIQRCMECVIDTQYQLFDTISYLETSVQLQQDGKLAAEIHFQRAVGHLDHLDLQFLIGFEFANEHH